MAIDFPNSPTTGDTYTAGGRTWQWDGTVWAAYGNYPDPTVLKIDTGTNRVGINNTSPTTALDVTGDLTVSGTITGGSISGAGMTVSSTAPLSPSAGEMWYNDTTGRTFVYYNDGSSSQWVEFGVPPEGSTIALASYADSAARTTAIPSPTEADLSYLQDTNSVEVYDGSAWTAVGGGKILQVVSTTKSDTFSTTSTSLTDITGLSVSITPTSASSKVFVTLTIGQVDASAVSAYVFDVTRAGTPVGVGDAAGSRTRGGAAGAVDPVNRGVSVVWSYLDSPATTSATTYQARCQIGSGTLWVNRSDSATDAAVYGRTVATLTVMEVSA